VLQLGFNEPDQNYTHTHSHTHSQHIHIYAHTYVFVICVICNLAKLLLSLRVLAK